MKTPIRGERPILAGDGERVVGPEVEWTPEQREELTRRLEEFDRARAAALVSARNYWIVRR